MPTHPLTAPWPTWKKVLFRFFAIYFLLYMSPWTWLDSVPGLGIATGLLNAYYSDATNWAVEAANRHLFHVRDVLVYPNGSGDTSFNWAQVWLYLSVAAVGALVWSLLDRRRANYNRADYALRSVVRYYVASVALSYGILKLFALQMTFPNLSQLATPLGDLLPMRLSWLFIGYSTPYQVFSGAVEVLAGLLLFYRRTVTLGLLVGAGVFANVVVLNLSYDIPVKLYSLHLLGFCLYLLVHDYRRLAQFFILNQPTTANAWYDVEWPKPWMRTAQRVMKAVLVLVYCVLPVYANWARYQSNWERASQLPPFPPGVYDVAEFAVNRDTIPALPTDTLRWKDVIFEPGGQGSVNTTDTLFRQRYRRGYFAYAPDTVRRRIAWKRFPQDTVALLDFRYETAGPNTVRLWGKLRGDSLYVRLVRSNRRFQLAERQFHWLSEANR